jgi:putative addiction module killer protein
VVERLHRLQAGNPGDVKPVGEGLTEMRIDIGPGYRVYYCRRGDDLVVLYGGDKDTQDRDIRFAQALARELED